MSVQKTLPPTRSYAKIRVGHQGPIATITLYNPDRRNAIGQQMVNELLWAISDANDEPDVRVIVITGHGVAFCSGGDFAQMTGSADGGPQLPHKGDYADLLLAMLHNEKPIVARVNGHALGGGLGLVAASTFAIAAQNAELGTPEINVGLFPMMIMAVLARHMPRRRLLEMMLLGQKLTAQEAVPCGLLNSAVPEGELDEAVAELVDDLVSRSPTAIRLGLRAFAAQEDMALVDSIPMLREKLAECLGTEDAREGLTAFLQKRKPNWTGK